MRTTNETVIVKLNQYIRTESPYQVEIPGPYSDTYDMELKNKQAGYHYFDRDAKRFFRSRINPDVIEGRFFFDSIQFERAARQYKIRAVLDNGATSSVVAPDRDGVLCEDFPSLDSARRALGRLLKDAK